jgi:hypothetical protein
MMESPDQAAAPPTRGVPTFAVEVAVALILLAFGLLVLFGSRNLGAGWTSDGPGAGYFPFYIGLILCIASAGTLWQAAGKARRSGIFADGEQLRRVLTVLAPAIVYVGAIQLVGLYVASAVYIAAFMVVLGKFRPLRSVLTGLVVAAVFFAMFEVWFKVPLFKGSLDPLRFLGY